MKRNLVAVVIVIALLAVAILAWTNFGQDEPEADTAAAGNVTTPSVDEDPSDHQAEDVDGEDVSDVGSGPSELALLPVMDSNQGGGNVVGVGGGGKEGAPAPAVGEMSTMLAPDFGAIFVDATYTLNTTLPLEPLNAQVLQHSYDAVELVDAQRIAERFGFAGPVYTERFNFGPHVMIAEEVPVEPSSEEAGVSVARPPVEEEIRFEPPTVYHAFDGKRHLSIFEDSVVYINRAVLLDHEEQVPNALQIAETFLQEKGLLDFPYLLEEGFGNGEVHVRRLVNDLLLDDPEIYVQVAGNGEIAFANDRNAAGALETLGDYPLLSAEAAWQLILDDVVGNNISFNIMPDFENMVEPVSRPEFERPQYWQREYQPGAEAHLYAGPMIYLRADGNGPPRLELNDFVLAGSDEDLQAIAEQDSHMFHIWGQIADDNATLNLAGWEPLEDPPHLSTDGHIQRTTDQVLFLSSSDETYILPDAPVDLPDGMKVNLFAWASRDVGLAYPVLDWQNIDEWFDYTSEPIAVPMPEPGGIEADYVDPYQFTEITIDEVKLAFMRIYDFEGFDKRSRPPEYIQPAWEFTGVTDNGDTIQLRVQAVAPEYLQTPSR